MGDTEDQSIGPVVDLSGSDGLLIAERLWKEKEYERRACHTWMLSPVIPSRLRQTVYDVIDRLLPRSTESNKSRNMRK